MSCNTTRPFYVCTFVFEVSVQLNYMFSNLFFNHVDSFSPVDCICTRIYLPPDHIVAKRRTLVPDVFFPNTVLSFKIFL